MKLFKISSHHPEKKNEIHFSAHFVYNTKNKIILTAYGKFLRTIFSCTPVEHLNILLRIGEQNSVSPLDLFDVILEKSISNTKF